MTEFIDPKRSKLSKKQRLSVFVKHAGVCYLCGTNIRPGETWEVEHILPVGLGGDNSEDNLRPAHTKCHKPKTSGDVGKMRKADRLKAKHFGAKTKTGSIPGSKQSKWKRKMDGTVVRRDERD